MSENILPISGDDLSSYVEPAPRQVLRICLNLKYLIDRVIPIQFDEAVVLSADSKILTSKVVQLALEAAGGEGDGKRGTSSYKYRSVLIFALLKVTGWYYELSATELHDSELYALRASTAQQLAKLIIEEQQDDTQLFIHMLCHRYVVSLNSELSEPANALELAVDMHSTIIIGSSGYQRCVKWLWRGWIIQSADDPSSYVMYKQTGKSTLSAHFDPDRIKTPMYQNALEIGFTVFYLVLYTLIVNKDDKGPVSLNIAEYLFYISTFSYLYDEAQKLYHIGWNYISFWSILNDALYALVSASAGLRIWSLTLDWDSPTAIRLDEASFRLLSLAAPLMYGRLLLYLDAEKFVGAMIVVVKVMMKESIIFFFLLILVILGFLQGFLGLDSSDGRRDATILIIEQLGQTILGGGDFSAFERFVPPYAGILYYFYSFLVTVILLNILVALYASAYQKIYDNANDEYMALVASKTLRYIRAPDSCVFVPPLNIIEIVLSPTSLLLTHGQYHELLYRIMLVIYSPVLCFIAIKETREARRVQYNRSKRLSDDANEVDHEWDLTDGYEDSYEGIFATSGTADTIERNNREINEQLAAERADPQFRVKSEWFGKVKSLAPPIEQGVDSRVGWELYPLYEKVETLTKLVETLVEDNKELKQRLNSQK
ncbi:YVC1 [Cyberlindnera jadinii]|uniref:YVC1 protein n=1 Tax=Cyberlindnera jadinii (strain ATCC 18201 / CBS 1600 / BCRC 20928 / JCM 3617 / NBRC 0987 / NRRL Y-1542) TaxID=983966 RepID=A0A0H5C4D3_CYBJN|nr:hypothetical protein CYBJADRAFT_123387 [Cyberlindnera jadinii NRRL Y-1542]ODV75480.1 hypothetical protein CYBJADRAFT_123387 [Cyberlindnera jadinii NRRL Y-1542]CEP22612.1 YVC1 [Cyberlindnera jadinii]